MSSNARRSFLSVVCLILILTLTAVTPTKAASIINVPDDYPTIQKAVDAASAGDTIIVRDGTSHLH